MNNMNNIAGPPVEGKDFFGRKATLNVLRGLLDHHDILLLGPRRIGKTSIARKVIATVREEGWRAIEINVAACPDERDLLDRLNTALSAEFDSIADKVKKVVSSPFVAIADRIKSVRITLPDTASIEAALGENRVEDWTYVASDLLRLVGQRDESTLIYIDELPILLYNILKNDPENGTRRIRRFLDWFRNDVRNLPGAARVRWLVSGSVGLDTLVQQHGMADTINSMKHQTLEAFSDEEALALLQRLAASYTIPLTEDEAKKIVAAIQWPQPYYVQFFFNELRAILQASATVGPAGLVEQAIERMIQPGTDNDFHHWEQRLSLQLGSADAGHALALLGLTAQDPQGLRPDTLLANLQERLPNASLEETQRTFIRLRDILIRDAYWHLDEGSGVRRYRFRLEPLRRWWLRRNTL